MILEGKKALVIGGSRGIGRAITLALASEGATVAFTYHLDGKAARETAAAIKEEKRFCLVSRLDLASRKQIERLYEELKDSLGGLDIYIHSAVSARLRPILELESRHWDQVLEANLTGFFECSRKAVSLMQGRSGRIIAVSSLGARTCYPGYAALGVAKAGMETLARYLAVELAEKNVNVNVVCPGIVETQALSAFTGLVSDLEDFKATLVTKTPARRMGTPEDVAKVVLYLCGPDSTWIRGQTIVCDGGLSLT